MGRLDPDEPSADAQRGVERLVTEALDQFQAAAEQSLDVQFYDDLLLTAVAAYAIPGAFAPLPRALRAGDRGSTRAVSSSLLTLPVRVGLRGAQASLQLTAAVTDRALAVVGSLAGAVRSSDRQRFDIDGEPLGGVPDPTPAPAPPGPAPAPPPPPPAPTPPPPGPEPAPGPPPAPPGPPDPPPPPHISTESDLVESVAEAGAEDGAGAQIHTDAPWDGYDALRAADVVDRIAGAQVAELAAVQLYERAGRRRQTVLDAVERELRRAPGQ